MASAKKSGGETMEMTEQIEATVREVGARVRPQIDEAKKRLSSLDETVTDYIKENPGTCLLGALAVGYLIGKIARKAG
jgi:ElaB/YqjD/DUF883 family membrane-anchored ribosome-binding protein